MSPKDQGRRWFNVPLGAFYVAVRLKKMRSDQGRYYHATRTIEINDKLTGDDLKATVIHEMLHAVCHLYGMDETDKESVVRVLEMGLTQMLGPYLTLPIVGPCSDDVPCVDD